MYEDQLPANSSATATNHAAVTFDVHTRVYRALLFMEASTAAVVKDLAGNNVTLVNVPAYFIYPVHIKGIVASGTTVTAGTVIGLYGAPV